MKPDVRETICKNCAFAEHSDKADEIICIYDLSDNYEELVDGYNRCDYFQEKGKKSCEGTDKSCEKRG